MKNLTKHLLLLIIIFPAVIFLSSVFAEKSIASHCTPPFQAGSECAHGGACGDPSLILCADSQMCVENYSDCQAFSPTATPTPAPTSAPAAKLTWQLITVCDARAAPFSATCGNQTCSSNQTCIGSSSDTSTTCLQQGAGGKGSYCGTPDKSPNNFACSSLYCDPSLRCAENPRFTDTTPTVSPITGPTATLTPAIACATKTDCKDPPECRTVEGRQCINPGLQSAVCIYGTKPKGVPCIIGGEKGTCSNNGFCDLSAPTPTLTPTITPTGSPTPTPTPIPPGMTSAHFKIALFGIVDSPSRPNRKLNIEIFDPENNNAKIADLTADIVHDPLVKQFKKNHVLDAIPKSGIYNIKVKSDGYLRRLILSVRINKGNQNDVALATLIPGDINGDNKIDLLDYNLFITCYGTKANQPTCDKTVLKLADFDDNIVIDGIDYNTFIKGLSVKEGD